RGRRLATGIHVVRDGEEAIDFLLNRGPYAPRDHCPPPRLVILDVVLPKVSGLDVLKTIKQNARTRDVPVVLLSSSSHQRDVERCYRLGANSYVQKPADLGRFREVLQAVAFYWLMLNHPPPHGTAGAKTSESAG